MSPQYDTYDAYTYMYKEDEAVKFYSLLVIIFNIIFAVLGAIMMALGFYIRLEDDFKMWVNDLEMQHYWIGIYILLIAGGLVMVQSFFGICGAYQKKAFLLKIFWVCMLICFILELAGAIYTLVNGTTGSQIEPWLNDKFRELISEFDTNEQSKRIMNIIQEWVGCCGASGSLDYVKWNKVIPYTCYDPVTGNAWYMNGYGYVGCVRGFAMYLEHMSGWIAGVALLLAFFQIFCMIATCCLISLKRNYKMTRSAMNINKQ